MYPFVILQADFCLVKQTHGYKEWHVSVSDTVVEMLLTFFEGFERGYQVLELLLEVLVVFKFSEEATQILHCSVIVFPKAGKGGGRVVIQF